MTEFKIGDKVYPISKSTSRLLQDSIVWEKAQKNNQNYLFVVSINDNTITCSNIFNNNGDGDFFLEKDLLPMYTIQQLKDNPNIVVEISSKEQGDKLASVFSEQEKDLPWLGLEQEKGIIWSREQGHAWDLLSSIENFQTKILFEQVLFENQEKNQNMEKWCIKGNQNIDIIEYLNNKYNTNVGFYEKYYYFIKDNYLYYSPNIPEGYTLISIEKFEKFIQLYMKKTIIGYKLIKKYPGCKHEIGYIEPYTNGEYSEFPEFWEPIYEEIYKEMKLGDQGIKVRIYKDYILYINHQITFDNINLLLKPFNPHNVTLFDNTAKRRRVSYPSYSIKIGCTTFTSEEIKKLYELRNSL